MDTDSRWTLFFLAVLILISAFFSASEMALSAVNRMRLRTMAEDGDKRAALAARLADRFDRTLPVIWDIWTVLARQRPCWPPLRRRLES